MRKLIGFMAVALIGAAACKKTETEKAATEVRKASEKVDKERENLGKKSQDVTDEANKAAEQGKNVADAERRLVEARTKLSALVKGKIDLIDGKLAAVESRTDPLSKKLAVDLRARRDVVFTRTNTVDSIALANWDAYQKDVEGSVKDLDKDLDKAMTDDKDRDKLLKH